MTRCRRSALAATGLITLTAALGAALPAAAAPGAESIAGAGVKSECEPWSWGAMWRSVSDAIGDRFADKMVMTGYEGSADGSAVTDVSCLTSWTFTFNNARDPHGLGARVTVDLADDGIPVVRTAPRGREALATPSHPAEAVDEIQRRGYRHPFYTAGKSAVDDTGEATPYVQTTDLEYVRLIDDGRKVSHSAFTDLPASVVALPATFFRTGGVKDLPSYDCPVDRPYLWNADLDSGLKGTAVRRTYDEGTLNSPNLYVVDGLVGGWDATPDGLTTGTPERGEAYLYALCTDDRSLGYAPPTAG